MGKALLNLYSVGIKVLPVYSTKYLLLLALKLYYITKKYIYFYYFYFYHLFQILSKTLLIWNFLRYVSSEVFFWPVCLRSDYMIVLYQKNILQKIIDLLDIEKWLKRIYAYILTQRSCTTYTEAIRFFTIMLSNDFQTISSQTIGKQERILTRNYLFKMSMKNFIWKILSF